MTIGKLKEIDKQLNARFEQADFVTITFDPENDTPKHWRLTKKINVHSSNWHFLSGSLENTKRVLAYLGISDFLKWVALCCTISGSQFWIKMDIEHSLDWNHTNVDAIFVKHE